MSDLLSIGRFAERSGLTVKALRLYDQRGLLRPAMVDFDSGYRYYHRDQLALARGIQRLRALDMGLDDIAALLQAEDAAAVEACLNRHRRVLSERIAGYETALKALPDAREWLESTGKEFHVEEEKEYTCSFCSKSRSEVERMIAGPNGVIICNECVDLCNKILAGAREQPAEA